MMMAAHVVTNSEITCFRSCPQKHEYRYEQLLRPLRVTPSLEYGTRFHKALEQFYKGEPVTEPDLIHGYRRVSGDVVAVEHEVARRVGEFTFAGKLDLIVRQDRVYIVEHKTTSSSIDPGSMYWEQAYHSSQLTMYRMLYPEADGVILDVQQKRSKKYAQVLISHSADQLERAKETLLDWARKLRYSLIPVRNTDACFTWNTPCEFLAMCEGGTTDGLRKATRRHEELDTVRGGSPHGADVGEVPEYEDRRAPGCAGCGRHDGGVLC